MSELKIGRGGEKFGRLESPEMKPTVEEIEGRAIERVMDPMKQ